MLCYVVMLLCCYVVMLCYVMLCYVMLCYVKSFQYTSLSVLHFLYVPGRKVGIKILIRCTSASYNYGAITMFYNAKRNRVLVQIPRAHLLINAKLKLTNYCN